VGASRCEPSIRILPVDGAGSHTPIDPAHHHRWLLSAAVLATTAAFIYSTGSSETLAPTPSLSQPGPLASVEVTTLDFRTAPVPAATRTWSGPVVRDHGMSDPADKDAAFCTDSMQDLEGAELLGSSSSRYNHFAYGTENDEPAVFWSSDKIDWYRAVVPHAGRGIIVDIQSDGERNVALGLAPARTGSITISLWTSNDGANWLPLATDATQLVRRETRIDIVTAQPGDNPVAEIMVDGKETIVTVGTTIASDNGLVSVQEINESSVDLSTDIGEQMTIPVGHNASLRTEVESLRLAVDGPRLVIVGNTVRGDTSTPIVWTSPDNGDTWETRVLPGRAMDSYEASTQGETIVIEGFDHQTTEIWRNTWDTTETERSAVDLTQRYLAAVARQDAVSLIDILPQSYTDAQASGFEVPGLGHVQPDWWDTARRLDIHAVVDTVDYLKAVNTSLAIGDCTADVTLGDTEVTNVACTYSVRSDLLSSFGIQSGVGCAHATLRNGSLESVTLDPAPAASVWPPLSASLGAESDEQIPFNGDAATAHLAVARNYLPGLLRPGETRTVETALGTMEWTWIEPLSDVGASSDTAPTSEIPGIYLVSDNGTHVQCLTSSSASDCPYLTTLWTAGNGTPWRELAGGSGYWVTADIGVGPLGLVAATSEPEPSNRPRPVLVSVDGVSWEEVAGIALLDTSEEARTWVSPPIVGSDNIVLIGSAARTKSVPHLETDGLAVDNRHLFMIVGRLVDQ